MKKIYRGWKVLQVRTRLGYDPSTDRVICSDDAWQSFIQVHKECNHLRHKGLHHKELYYNLFEKIMQQVPRDLGEEPTSTNDGWQGVHRRAGDEAGPSRSRGSFGKRKH
ncbi:hypothetical protein TIFTF001_030190 [Ficus carica]|uniref:Uncharacterized protein n=1 Tax=Ficus carica TaxID=3494 RepID=A0AA88J3E9_FICCA|nr:hypothetical protein TIFTF001_030190 [Ficus carica]